MKYALQILVLVSITFVCVSAHGQDIAQIGKDKPFKMSGGLSAYTGFYSTDLSDPRQVPLTGGVQGNLNLSIYDPLFTQKKTGHSDNRSISMALVPVISGSRFMLGTAA